MTTTPPPPALELIDLEKTYGNGVRAVRGVTLSIRPGEIHSIVGENGAGKSTLMKLAYGLERPSAGSIRAFGRPTFISSPRGAIDAGIGMVHQNLMLVPSFTVAENIALGHEPGSTLRVDRIAAIARAQALASDVGLAVDPNAIVKDASVGMRQRVEILKAIGRGAKVLILDEPTAVLAPQESDDLFAAVRRLRARGLTVVLISHKLDEVRAISDRISVMRQGGLVATYDVEDTSESSLAAAMVGRSIDLDVARAPARAGGAVLRVRDVTITSGDGPRVGPVSFDVRAGEIVGIAGIEDNGQNQIVRAIAGLDAQSSGAIELDGTDITQLSVLDRRRARISHIPEDRFDNGAALDLSIADNLIVDRYSRPPLTRRGILSPGSVRDLASTLIRTYSVKAPDPRVTARSLSGGNMQKVIVARELSAQPKLILAAHPTRGVDIGATEFMYSQFVAARDRGAAVLLLSADLTELLALSDRLYVIRSGRFVGRFDHTAGLTEERVGRFMLGVDRHDDSVINRPRSLEEEKE